jgi:DNA-binding LytR/AlgR family response regulator
MTVSASLDGKSPARSRLIVLVAIWIGVVSVACVIRILIQLSELGAGSGVPLWEPISWEVSSHLAHLPLLPVLYWLDRRWPPLGRRRNLLVHLAAIAPWSVAHTLLMLLARVQVYRLVGGHYRVGSILDRIDYEFGKDIFNYVIILALIHLIRAIVKPAAAAPPIAAAPIEPAPAVGALDRFAVRRDGREILVPASAVARFESAGNYVVLHTQDGRFDVRATLTELEKQLDPAKFVRIHRSNIVQLDQIREIQPWNSGDYRLILRDGSQVNLSRRYRARLDRLILARG